jgi:type IV fimbrial biogenesis protein FimT
MVGRRRIDAVKQRGFTIVELVITLVIAGIVIAMATPIMRSSIAEHRALAMVAALKTDFEWARNNAVSTNQGVSVSIASNTVCEWSVSVIHQMTTANLANYNGVACVFSGSSPVFNGMGFSTAGVFTATISATGTSRVWLLTLLGSGDLTVKAQ